MADQAYGPEGPPNYPDEGLESEGLSRLEACRIWKSLWDLDLRECYFFASPQRQRQIQSYNQPPQQRLLDAAELNTDFAMELTDDFATEVINTATHIGIAMCHCRHIAMHRGTACDAPMDICMTFNTGAETLIRHGHVRQVDKAECLDLLQQAKEHNLVQFGENAQRNVSFICNCCGCCCEAMKGARHFGHLRPVHTTNFLPEVSAEQCSGCGKCVSLCPVEALSLVSAHDPDNHNRKTAQLDEDRCLGCGVCVRPCARAAIRLKPRKARVLTPVNSVHRFVIQAIERGKLQNLLFDNQAYTSHRAMGAVLGAILKLPPVKRAMAKKQMDSRYVDALLAKQE